MSKFVLLNARIFVAGADLSGSSNKVELSSEREAKDVTTYTSGGWNERLAGLGSASINAAGFFEAGGTTPTDDTAFGQLGSVGAWSVTPSTPTIGTVAYFSQFLDTSYALLGDVGEAAPFTLAGESSWPLARGQVAVNPGSAITTTQNGSGINLGTVSSSQHLYAAVHVVSVSGTTPSLTVAIQSDNDGGAFGSPTTRHTFSAASAVGSQIARVAGPITDDWFRATLTVSGTSPSFLALVVIGIA